MFEKECLVLELRTNQSDEKNTVEYETPTLKEEVHNSLKSITQIVMIMGGGDGMPSQETLKQWLQFMRSLPSLESIDIEEFATMENVQVALVFLETLLDATFPLNSIQIKLYADEMNNLHIDGHVLVQYASTILRCHRVATVNIHPRWDQASVTDMYHWVVQHPQQIVLTTYQGDELFEFNLPKRKGLPENWCLWESVPSLSEATVVLTKPSVTLEKDALQLPTILRAPNLTRLQLNVDRTPEMDDDDDDRLDWIDAYARCLQTCRNTRYVRIIYDGGDNEDDDDPDSQSSQLRIDIMSRIICAVGRMPNVQKLAVDKGMKDVPWDEDVDVDASTQMFPSLKEVELDEDELCDDVDQRKPHELLRYMFTIASDRIRNQITKLDIKGECNIVVLSDLWHQCPNLVEFSCERFLMGPPDDWEFFLAAIKRHRHILSLKVDSVVIRRDSDIYDTHKPYPGPDPKAISLLWFTFGGRVRRHEWFDDELDVKKEAWWISTIHNLRSAVMENAKIHGIDRLQSCYLACLWANQNHPLRNSCLDLVLNEFENDFLRAFRNPNGTWKDGMFTKLRKYIEDAIYVPASWQAIVQRWKRQVQDKTMTVEEYTRKMESLESAKQKLLKFQMIENGEIVGNGTRAEYDREKAKRKGGAGTKRSHAELSMLTEQEQKMDLAATNVPPSSDARGGNPGFESQRQQQRSASDDAMMNERQINAVWTRM